MNINWTRRQHNNIMQSTTESNCTNGKSPIRRSPYIRCEICRILCHTTCTSIIACLSYFLFASTRPRNGSLELRHQLVQHADELSSLISNQMSAVGLDFRLDSLRAVQSKLERAAAIFREPNHPKWSVIDSHRLNKVIVSEKSYHQIDQTCLQIKRRSVQQCAVPMTASMAQLKKKYPVYLSIDHQQLPFVGFMVNGECECVQWILGKLKISEAIIDLIYH